MPDRLRVLFITEDDPLYVIRLFEVFFREYPADAIEVCGPLSEAEFRDDVGRFPYAPWRAGIRRILRSGAPYMFYIHPWEIDPGQPRIRELGAVSRFRHYINLERCEGRFRALLDGFSWTTVRSVLDGWKREQAAVPAGFGSG